MGWQFLTDFAFFGLLGVLAFVPIVALIKQLMGPDCATISLLQPTTKRALPQTNPIHPSTKSNRGITGADPVGRS